MEEAGWLLPMVDAILVGGQTFRNWPSPQMPVGNEQKWFVVVSRSLNFHLVSVLFSDFIMQK